MNEKAALEKSGLSAIILEAKEGRAYAIDSNINSACSCGFFIVIVHCVVDFFQRH
uniref:Uncharacterized protein n=1 Tax=Bartonella rochalimae ATCC BAA-1498 TaxID=685782 RepID=E6YM35_9HYPH|nr:hypothetical protein BARRO_50286 [Bartonella rochalimae ATCC BAA-1498]